MSESLLRAAAGALLRVLLFLMLFVVLQFALSAGLLAIVPADALLVDTAAVLVAALVAGIVLLRVLEREPARTLGFPLTAAAAGRFFGGLAIGAGALLLAGLGLVAVGALRFRTDAGTATDWAAGMLSMLLVLAVPAAAEEALFRGYPFQKLVEGVGATAATLGASALFALAHAGNPSVNGFALVNIFVAGVMLSVAYLRSRSLWFATGVHLGWNWSMAALLDLPVSGLELFDAPLYEPVERGPAWLSGGGFGPEAGVAGLAGLLLALAGVVWISRKPEWRTSTR